MKSGIHHITIENGSTFELDLALTNDDDSTFDITGYTAQMMIRNLNDTLVLDCANYVTINDTNHVTVDIPASATTSIADSDGVYQIEIKSGSKEYSILRGKVEFIRAVIK